MVMIRNMILLALISAATPALAEGPVLAPGETLFEAQAVGEASARPDSGLMSFGVVSTGTTARAATDANAAVMAAVIAAIRKAGVDGRFVRTDQISVQPRFARASPSDDEGQANITGYVARNIVSVSLVKLTAASEVIAAAFGAGANMANGPSLQLADNAGTLAVARRDAAAKARVEADTYAEALGMKVARILRVSERGAQETMSRSLNSYAGSLPSAESLATGEVQQRVTVWIDYALVPK